MIADAPTPHTASDTPADAEFVAAAECLAALGRDTRLKILHHLWHAGELPVGDLAGRIGITTSAASQNLYRLRVAGLLTTRRDAQKVYYRLTEHTVYDFLPRLYPELFPPRG